jgi:hypothetical protein
MYRNHRQQDEASSGGLVRALWSVDESIDSRGSKDEGSSQITDNLQKKSVKGGDGLLWHHVTYRHTVSTGGI